MAVTTADGFIIPIGIDDKASPGFNKMAGKAGKIIKTMGVLGGSIVVVNQAFALMGRTLQAANRIFEATFGNFAKFEDALIGVGKTSNLAGAELQMLGDQFQSMSERIPKSAAELADIAKVAGQLGVEGSEDILRFTETMAKLESASDLAGETGASQIARILNIVEGGVKNVDRFGASIVALGNNFAATEAEIAHMATEVARSTAIFKPTSAQVLGLSTAMKALGIQAQLGGSVVGRAMREIQATIQTGAGAGFDTLQSLTGIVGKDLKKAFETDATAVFQKFVEGLGSIDPSQITSKLEDLGLKGDEVAKVLPVLATRSELLGEALQVANKGYKENVALNEEAERAFKSLSSQMKILGNQVTNIATDFAQEMSPALIELIKLFRENLKGAVELVKNSFKAFSTAIDGIDFDKITKDMEGFALAAGVVATVLTGPALAKGLTSLTGFLLKANIPASALALKFGLIAAAILSIAAAIDIVSRNFDKLPQLADLAGSAFIKVVSEIGSAFSKMLLFVVQKISQMITALGQAIPGMSKIALAAQGILNSVSESLVDNIIAAEQVSEQASKDIEKNAEGIDFGFAGDIFEEGKKFLESFNKELEKTSDIAGGIEDNMPVFGPDLPPGFGDSPAPEGKKVKGSLFSDEDLGLIKDSFGGSVSEFAGAANSMLAVPMAMAGAANVMLDAVQGLIDLIPQLLNKVADIFSSLNELPQAIVSAVINVFSSFADLLGNFFSNLINGVTDLLMSVVTFLVEQFPAAIQSIIEKLPEAIIGLLEKLPEIVEGLIFGLITSLVDLFIILPIELIKAVPKIIIALVKAIPKVAIALVDGIITGLKSAINSISESLGFGEIFNLGEVGKEFEEVGDKIAKSSSQLFAVVDLEASQRGLDLADKIRNAISSSGKEVGNVFKRLWAALTAAWMWVRENIVDPLIDGVLFVWNWVMTNIVDPLVNGLMAVWSWVVDNVVNPLVDGLTAVWDFVIDKVINRVLDAMRSLFDGLGGIINGIVNAVKALFNGDFSGIKNALSDGFKAGMAGLAGAFKALINPWIDLFNSLKLPEVEVSGKVFGKSFGFTLIPAVDLIPGTIARLQEGGEVQHYQSGGIAGTDSVDASLTPGEFVVNRQSTGANLNLLKSINNSKGPVSGSGGGNTTVNVVINAKTSMDQKSIRRELMPEIRKELKKESQRGGFVISQRGIRA